MPQAHMYVANLPNKESFVQHRTQQYMEMRPTDYYLEAYRMLLLERLAFHDPLPYEMPDRNAYKKSSRHSFIPPT